MLVDEGEHAIAVELGLPHPVGVVEGRVADFREHRRELCRHRLDLAGRDELRGGDPMRGNDLEIFDRDAGEHRAVLLRDIVLRTRTGPCA